MKEKKASILIVGINFHPEPTGIGKYTGEFAFHLGKKGLDVDVITGFPYYPNWKVFDGYGNWFYKSETQGGVNITRCPLYVPQTTTGLKRMLQDLSFFITAFIILLIRMLSFKQYEMIFVASPSFLSGFLGGFYRFFYRKAKFIYHVQDLQIDAAEELGMIKSNKLLSLLKYLEHHILGHADWVTTISGGMQRKISSKKARIQKQYLFPNWVDFKSIYPKEASFKVLKQLNFPLYKRVVLYSGAVGEKQGLEVILDMAQRAKSSLPDIHFIISGSGPYAKVLEQKAQLQELDNLLFIGLQPLEVFNEMLNHASIHLVIQKDKASNLLLPSKLTNILAVGGLCIVTAAEGTSLHDIVHGNNIGMAIPPENPDALWQAIFDAETQKEKAALYKENAMKYAAAYLKKEAIIESFIDEIGLSKVPQGIPVEALGYGVS